MYVTNLKLFPAGIHHVEVNTALVQNNTICSFLLANTSLKSQTRISQMVRINIKYENVANLNAQVIFSLFVEFGGP